MLPLIASSTAVLALTFSVAKMTFPRWMPNYQVINLSLKKITLKSLLRSGEISMTINAGVQVDYSFYVGAELHASHVDLFYPDWNGNLQYVADFMIIDNNLNESKDAKDESNRKNKTPEEESQADVEVRYRELEGL